MRIEGLEIVVADHQFAAHRPVHFAGVPGGFQLDQRQFVGDVFAEFAVAARGENAPVEVGGNAVVFRLDQQLLVLAAGELLRPLQHFFERIGLVQRQHRPEMPHLAGTGDGRGVDAGDQFVIRFELLQCADEFVVTRVRDFRLPLVPVAPVVVFDQPDQFVAVQLFGDEVFRIHEKNAFRAVRP